MWAGINTTSSICVRGRLGQHTSSSARRRTSTVSPLRSGEATLGRIHLEWNRERILFFQVVIPAQGLRHRSRNCSAMSCQRTNGRCQCCAPPRRPSCVNRRCTGFLSCYAVARNDASLPRAIRQPTSLSAADTLAGSPSWTPTTSVPPSLSVIFISPRSAGFCVSNSSISTTRSFGTSSTKRPL